MNEMKPSLYDYTQKELIEQIKPAFRVKQIYGWLYHQYAQSFDDMKNIPKSLKEELAQKFVVNPLTIVNKEESSDGTIKYLLIKYCCTSPIIFNANSVEKMQVFCAWSSFRMSA